VPVHALADIAELVISMIMLIRDVHVYAFTDPFIFCCSSCICGYCSFFREKQQVHNLTFFVPN
jgi:hypothetical protein